MWVRVLLAVCFAAGLAACATQAPVVFSPNDVCSESAPTYDSREVRCQFPRTELTRKFRFTANFSGGHDDTTARIEPFIDNAPFNCDEGSKIHLFGEDGEVSLWCIFSVAEHRQGDGVFKVTVRWGHAQYVNYEVTAFGN